MNCLIENEYIKVTKREKNRKRKKKNGKKQTEKKDTEKKNGKNQLAYFITGGVIIFSRELAYFIAGGLLTPCEHWFV